MRKKKIKQLKEYRKDILSSFTVAELNNPITYESIKTALIKIDRAMTNQLVGIKVGEV